MGTEAKAVENLSPRWRWAVILTMVLGFSVLGLLMVKTYTNAPPVPEQVIDTAGRPLFSGNDIRAGQQIFLK